MTQTNETNSRIARLEALMLEIAASNLRHDRDIDRQDNTLVRHNERITQHEQRQVESEEWQRQHERRIAEHEEWQRQHEAAIARHDEWQRQQDERMAEFTAGLLELRNLVTDYLRGRSNLE